MTIKNNLDRLHETDIWSLLLFTLYRMKNIPEFSSLSELAYVLDKKNLFKLCEYCGGTKIKIPTIQELEQGLYSLLLFQLIDIENYTFESAINELDITDKEKIRSLKAEYKKVKDIMTKYDFTPRNRI